MTINFSAISPSSAMGRAARFLAYRMVPPKVKIPILQGPARGKRWIAGAHVPACWLGCYEVSKQKLLQSELRPGDVFYDVGANRGYFTLVASALVGTGGRVIAFEPLPDNLTYLYEHLRCNAINNVTVVEAAVARATGSAFFDAGAHPKGVSAHLSETGSIQVRCVSMDDAIGQEGYPPPTHIKIDVEGGETDVLQGAIQTLTAHHPMMIIDTHGREQHDGCRELLHGAGYRVVNLREETYTLDDGTERYYGELLARKPSI